MNAKEIGIVALLAWGVPLLIVIMVRTMTPNPAQPKETFPSAIFTPVKMEWVKKGSQKSDYFELWIHHPSGAAYFLRDPEQGPVESLYRKIPQNVPLKVVYRETLAGNTLLDVAAADSPSQSFLSYTDIMAVYAARRKLVYTIAAIWSGVGTLFLLGLWMGKPKRARHDGMRD